MRGWLTATASGAPPACAAVAAACVAALAASRARAAAVPRADHRRARLGRLNALSPRRPVNAWLRRCAAPRAGTAAGASRCRRTVTEAHYAAFSLMLLVGLPNRVDPGRNGTGSL